MRTHVLLFLACLVAFAGSRTAAGQGEAFTVKTITLNGTTIPAYDMKVSPEEKTAAVYVGRTAANLLGLAPTGYTVTAAMLPIHLIDLTSGSESGLLTGNTDLIADGAFSPDGKQFAVSQYNGDIYVWDVASRQLTTHVQGLLGGGATQIRFLADGKSLVALQTGTVSQFLTWDLTTGYITRILHPAYKTYGELKLTDPLGRFDYIYVTFDVTPDGALLAAATGNGQVSVWDTKTFKESVVQPPAAQPGALNVRRVRFSANLKTLAYYDFITKSTDVWDLASGSITKRVPAGAPAWALSPDNQTLVFATTKDLSLVNVDRPDTVTKVLDFPSNVHTPGPEISFSPDGKQMVVGGFYASDGDNVLYVVTLNR